MEASTSAGTSKSITSGSSSFTSDMFPGSDLLSFSRCSGAVYLLHNSSGVASGCFSCGEVGEMSSVFCVLCLDQQFFGLYVEEQHVAGNSHLVLVQPVVLVVAQCSQISVWAEGLVQQSVHVDAESSKDHQIAAQGAKDLDLEL